MRLFLALDVPEDIQSRIDALYLPEYQKVRWTPLKQLHLTLVFIGSQPQVSLEEILEKTAEVEFQSFQLTATEVGHFKSGVIWLGIEKSAELNRLQQQLKNKLSELDLKLEHRKFKPHITLGRTKRIEAGFMEHLSRHAFGFKCSWQVDSFQLKSSILSPDGAVYQTEGEFVSDLSETNSTQRNCYK